MTELGWVLVVVSASLAVGVMRLLISAEWRDWRNRRHLEKLRKNATLSRAGHRR